MYKSDFDKILKGKKIQLFTLANKNGVTVGITNYGATVVSIHVPDKNGTFKDVVLGYDTIDDYVKGNAFFGATVGRYANRIASGKFTIAEQTHHVLVNDGENHLHGGLKGFNRVVWNVEFFKKGQALHLSYLSKDGEENYPGNLLVKVIYTLTEENELNISYQATTDKTTIVNLTNHSYFNLAGEGNGTILDHKMMINASQFTPVDSALIPTGEIRYVANTPMDFRIPTTIGKYVDANDEQLNFGNGFDHNWILKKNNGAVMMAAHVHEPNSGRHLEVWTDQPGIQFYTANFLNETDKGKAGNVYKNRAAFCLETQHFPDSPNHPHFPSTVLKPDEVYSHTCIYKFMLK